MKIALYQPDIAGNVGTILRLSACMGVEVDIIEPCGFPFNMKKIRRAGMDYIDYVKINRYSSFDEFLEKNKVGFIKPNLTFPGRQIAGGQIQLNLFEARKRMKDAQWGILQASEGEFIVPDNFSTARILPISPTICFFSQSENAVISKKQVVIINGLSVSNSNDYYFANDLSKCEVKRLNG